MLNVLCISDLQCPAEHQDALAFVKHVDRVFFPDGKRFVVNLGDEVDQHSLGRWPANPSGRSGGDELKEAIHHLRDWYSAFPKMYLCSSNHTYRAWKKAFHAGIPQEFMRSVGEVYEAPSTWLWKDKWVQDGVVFEHGENVSGALAALNAAKTNHAPTVIGHQHGYGGVIHADSISGKIWGLNTGCLIDTDHYAFAYGKNIRNKPTLGTGVIRNGVPYFIPMLVNSENRWVQYI